MQRKHFRTTPRRDRDSRKERPNGSSNRRLVGKLVNAEAVKALLLELDLDISIQQQPGFYNTALVLLSAPICGSDTGRLAKFTGLPPSFVAPIRKRMMQAELWTETKACCEGWFAEDGVLCPRCFWLDVLVADGLVMRAWDENEGQYCYGLSPQLAERVH
ncbi:MAG TPA: hypothetical protein VH437_11720 [Terriglobales bacterium]